jgi:hypothetical protein
VTASPAEAGGADEQDVAEDTAPDDAPADQAEASEPVQSIGSYGTDDLTAAIRKAFSAGGERDRETAIRGVATELGYQRLGKKIRHVIHHALRHAVHLGVIYNEDGMLGLDYRTIDDYPRELLRQALLTVVAREWWDRDKAISATAYYLGFRRVGSRIRKTLASVITGALRMGLLERDGDDIRRAR